MNVVVQDELSTKAEVPFPGLRPFAKGDHRFFFGREDQTFALYRLVRNHHFVAVVGSSGSGKSSLVQAGLLPLLDQENSQTSRSNWRYAILRPGQDPIDRLSEALAVLRGGPDDPHFEARLDRIRSTLLSSSLGISEAAGHALEDPESRLIVLVDQFEELFRYVSAGYAIDRKETALRREKAANFVQLLLGCIRLDSRVRVVITMRSDFIGECSRFQRLPEAVSAAQFLVPSLSRDQREEAIRAPIELAGGTISPELIERLLNESSSELDQLPVLQHCLARLWVRAGSSESQSISAADSCEGRHITEEHYRDIGKLSGALSKHADEIYLALPGLEKTVELIFRSLAEVDKEGRAVRRACPLEQLIAETGSSRDEVRTVIDKFRADDCSFIVPSISSVPADRLADETVVDVGHEAFLRCWVRVSGDPEATDERADRRDKGWLRQEKLDGERYQFLRSCVDSESLNETRLSDDQAKRYWNWWTQRKPTSAWAARYGGDFERVEGYVRNSYVTKKRERRIRNLGSAIAGVALILAAIGGTRVYQRQQLADKVFGVATKTAEEWSVTLLDAYNEGKISLDTAKMLLKSASNLFEKLDDDLPDSSAQAALKARWYLTASDIESSDKKIDEARKDAIESVRISRSFLGRDPGNREWQRRLYEGLFRLGDFAFAKFGPNGDAAALAQALGKYEESQRIASGLLAYEVDPHEMTLAGMEPVLLSKAEKVSRAKFDLAFATNKIGETRLRGGDAKAALKKFRRALEIANTIESSSRMEWKLEVPATEIKIGQALVETGDLDGALQSCSSAINSYKDILRDNSRSKILRSQSADAYAFRASLNGEKGDAAAALSDFSEAERLYLVLNADEPDSPSWLEKLVEMYNNEQNILKKAEGASGADLGDVLRKEAETRQKLSRIHP